MSELDGNEKAHGLLARTEDVLHAVGCLCLFAVLILISGDVLLRSTVKSTIAFQFELTEMFLMPALATLSLARVQRTGGHLAIDFLSLSRLGRCAGIVRRFNTAAPAMFFALVAWQSGKYALAAWQRNDINMGVIDWPMYVAYASIPIGTGLLAIRLLVDTFSASKAKKN